MVPQYAQFTYAKNGCTLRTAKKTEGEVARTTPPLASLYQSREAYRSLDSRFAATPTIEQMMPPNIQLIQKNLFQNDAGLKEP